MCSDNISGQEYCYERYHTSQCCPLCLHLPLICCCNNFSRCDLRFVKTKMCCSKEVWKMIHCRRLSAIIIIIIIVNSSSNFVFLTIAIIVNVNHDFWAVPICVLWKQSETCSSAVSCGLGYQTAIGDWITEFCFWWNFILGH